MGLLKFGLCVVIWVLCASESSADNTSLISSELECVEGQDLPSAEHCTKCICSQGKILCIDVDCDLEKKENATRRGPPRNSLNEKIRPPENIFNGPRHPLVDIINKQPITNGLPHLSSVYTKERNVIKMGKPAPNISMILTETHVENVLKTFLTHNHDKDDQYVLIVPEVSQENKYPDKRDTSLADTWEYNNKFQGQPSQTVTSEAFKNAPFPTYDSKRPYGLLFNENKQRYSSSIILDDQSLVPRARKSMVFGRPGDNRLLMRPRHEGFSKQQNKNKQFYPYSDSINHNVRSWFNPPTKDEINSAVKSAAKSKSQQMLESLARQKGFNFDFRTQYNNPYSPYPLVNEYIPNISFHTPYQPFPFSQNQYNYPNQPIINNYNNINGNSGILYDDAQEQMLGNDQYYIDTMSPSANLPIYNNKLFASNPDSFKQLSSNWPDISYSNINQPFGPLPAPIQDPSKYQRPDNRYPDQFSNKQYTPDKMSPYNSEKSTSPLPSSQSYQKIQHSSMNNNIEFLTPWNVSPYIQPNQHNKPNNYPNSNLPQETPSDQINKDNAKPRLPNAIPYKQLQPLMNNNYADYKKNALHLNTESNMISNELIPDNAVDNTEFDPVSENKPEHKTSFPAKLFNNIPKFFSNVFQKKPHAIAPSYHDDVPSQQNTIIDDKPNNLAPHKKEHIPNNNEVPLEYSNMPDYQSYQMKPNGQEQFIPSNNGQLPYEDTHPNGNNIETEGHSNIPDYGNHEAKPTQTFKKPSKTYPKDKPSPFKFYPHKPKNLDNPFPQIFNNEPETNEYENIPITDKEPENLPNHKNIPIFNDYPNKLIPVPEMYQESKPSPTSNFPTSAYEPAVNNPQSYNDEPELYSDDEYIPVFNHYPQQYEEPHQYTPKKDKKPKMTPKPIFNYYPHKKPVHQSPVIINDKPEMYPDYEYIPIPDSYPQTNKYPVSERPQTYDKEPDIYPEVKRPNFQSVPHRPEKPSKIYPKLENIPTDNFYPHKPQKPENLPSPIIYDESEIYPDNSNTPFELYPNINKNLFNDYPQPFKEAPHIKGKNIPKFNNYPQKPKEHVYQIPQIFNEIPETFSDYVNVPASPNYSQMPIKASASPNPYNKVPKLQPTTKPSPLFKYYPHRPIKPINHTPQTLNDEPQIYPDNNSDPFETYPDVDKKDTNKYPQKYPKYKQRPIIEPKKPVNLKPVSKEVPPIFPISAGPKPYIDAPKLQPNPKQSPTFNFYPHKPDIPNNYPDYENIPLPDNISVKPKHPVTNTPHIYYNMPELQPTVQPYPIFKYYPHRPKEPTIYTPDILNNKPKNYPDNNIKPSEHIPKKDNKPFYNNPLTFNEIPKIYPEVSKSPMPNYNPYKPKEPIKPITQTFPTIPNNYPDYENIPLPDNISVKPKHPVTNTPQTYYNMPELQPTVQPNPIFKYYPHRPKEPTIYTPGILNNKPRNYPDNNIKPSEHIPKKDNKPFYNNPLNFNEIPKIYPEVSKSPMPNYNPYKPKEPIKPITHTFPTIPNNYPDYENIPLPDNISVKPKHPVTNTPQTYYNMPELQPTVKPNSIFKYYPHRPKEPIIYTPDIFNNKPKNYPDNNIKPSEHIPKIDNKPFYNNPLNFNEIPKIYPEVSKSPMPNYNPYKPKEPFKPITQTFPTIPNNYPDYENIPLPDNISVKPKHPVTNTPHIYYNMPELQPTVQPNPIFKYYPHRPKEPTIYTPDILNNKPKNYPDNNIKPSEHIQKIDNKPFYNNPLIFNEIPKIYPEVSKSPMPNYNPYKPKEPIKPITHTFPTIPNNYPDYENIPLPDNISVKPKHPVTNTPHTYYNMPELRPTVQPNPIFKYYPHRPKEPTIYTPDILNNKPKNYPDNNIKPSEHIPKIDNKPFYNNPLIFNEIPKIYPEVSKSPMPNYNPYKPKEPIKPITQTFPTIPNNYPDYENIPLPDNISVTPMHPVPNTPHTYYNMPELQPTVQPNPIFKYYPHRPKEPTIYTPGILNNKPRNYPDNNIKPSEHIPKIDNKPFYNNPPIFNEIFPHKPAEPKRPIILNNAPGNLPDYKEKVNPIITPKPFTNVPDLYPSNEHIPIFNYFTPKQPSQELNKQFPVYPKINPSPIFNNSPQKPKETDNFNLEIFNEEEKLYPDYDIIPTFDDNLYPSIDEEPTYANRPILNHAPEIYPIDKHKPIASVYPYIPEYALTNENPQTYNEAPNMNPKVTARPIYKGYSLIHNQPINYSPQNPMPVLTPMASPNNHELISPEEIKEFCRICKMLHCCPTTPLANFEHPICFNANIDVHHFDSDIHQYPQVYSESFSSQDYSDKGHIPFGWHNPDIQSDVSNDMPYLMTPFYDNLVDVVPITSDLQKRDIIFSDEINGILPIIAELHKNDELYNKELGMILSPFDYFDPSNSIKYHDLPVKSEIPKPKITQSKPDIYELGNNKNDLTDEPTKYNLNKPDGSEVYNQELESNLDSFIHFDHKGDNDKVDSEKNIWQSTELISKQPQVAANIIGNTAKESVKPKKKSKSSIDYSDFDNLPTYIDTKVRNRDPIRPKRYLVQRDTSQVVEDNSIDVPSVFNSIGKVMKYVRQSVKC